MRASIALAVSPALLAACASMAGTAPVPVNWPWITNEPDYPSAAARRGERGTVHAVLMVNPSGRVASCAIEKSSGSQLLDEATCRMHRRRAEFVPFRSSQMRAYRIAVTWDVCELSQPGPDWHIWDQSSCPNVTPPKRSQP